MAAVLFFRCWKRTSRVPNSPIVSSCGPYAPGGNVTDTGVSFGGPKHAVSLRICSVDTGIGSRSGDLPGRLFLNRLMNSAPLRYGKSSDSWIAMGAEEKIGIDD